MGAGGVVAALVAALATIFAAGCAAPEPVALADMAASHYSDPPEDPRVLPAPRVLADLDPTMALLDDKTRTWTLGVLGDSTGDAPDEWVYLTAHKLGAMYDRPVVIHDWNNAAQKYVSTTKTREGANAPVVVWNGSARGKNTSYSFQHWATMLPERPDLLIVNHGHNQSGAAAASAGIHSLIDWATAAWKVPPAAAVVLQNPRLDRFTKRQESVVATVREDWTGSLVAVIDAHSAYRKHNNMRSLLHEDGLHPNDAGSVVWAEAAFRTLTR
jgi:hypothetical protein